MLSRVALRSLRVPVPLPLPTSARITSTVWTRSMSRQNKPGNRHPGTSSSSQQQQQQQQKSRHGPNHGQHSGQNSGHNSSATRPTNANTSASQINNSTLNTAKAPEAKPATDPAEAHEPIDFELPDLTKGIPSTLEYETMGSSANFKSNRGPSALNLTEAEQPQESRGGRPRGELPASAYVSSSERRRLRMANYMYASFAGVFVAGTIYLGRNWETEDEEAKHTSAPSGWAVGLMWKRARARLGDQLNYYSEPAFEKLLPDLNPLFERPYTLVLSMEDLLIHSEWTREHGWRMAKRPGLDYFLRYLSQYYELVIFTSQPFAMAEPVIRKLDPYHIVTWPLFREATRYENGEYVKDLSFINRDLSKVIMMDTKSAHAKNQPENAIILKPWDGNAKDQELVAMIPFLEYIHTMGYDDVRKAIKSFEGTHIPTEFSKREAVARKRFEIEMAEENKKRPKHSGLGFLSNALGVKSQNMMVDPMDQTPAEAFAQGKMLQDLARERGQRNYELLEKEIRENGEKWLKEEAANEEKMKEEGMKAMKSGFTGMFGGPSTP